MEAEMPKSGAGTPEPQGRDPKEVAQYLPVPNVRRAIAAVVIPQIAVGMIGFGSGMLMLIAQTAWEWNWFHAITTAVLIGCLCTGIAWAISERPERLAKLRATSRRRNILGYTGMFWFEGGTLRFRPYENEKGWDGWTPRPDPIRAIGSCPKCPPWKDEHRVRYHQPYAMIPLGGRRSSFKNEYDYNGSVNVLGTVYPSGAGWKIGFVGLSPDGSDLLVTVTDPTGTTIRCSLRQAFTILTVADQITPRVGIGEIFCALVAGAFGCGPEPVTIGDVVAVMDRALRETMEERDAADAKRSRAKAARRQSTGSAPPA